MSDASSAKVAPKKKDVKSKSDKVTPTKAATPTKLAKSEAKVTKKRQSSAESVEEQKHNRVVVKINPKSKKVHVEIPAVSESESS